MAIDNRYEGSYVVRHGTWYYLTASAANCCAGPATGYSVFSGRSKSPLGPFVDADGIPLLASRVGGTLLVTQNGNRWIGAGHHAIATDASGRDFLVYHAIDRNQPWLDEPFGVNRRPMLLDRIDWVDGWPQVRAGAGPSDDRQPAPVTGSAYGIRPADPAAAGFTGLRDGPLDPQAGRTGEVRGAARTQATIDGRSLRLRLDLETSEPLTVSMGQGGKRASVQLDPDREWLRLVARRGGRTWVDTARITGDPDSWRTLTIELTKSSAIAQLSESDLGDPLAEVGLRIRGLSLPKAPVEINSPAALVDNITIRPLAQEAESTVAVPQAGRLIAAEEFDGELSSAWTWIREDRNATVTAGSLAWPLQAADLVGGGNDAGVLLRDTPSGTWIAETKLRLDLGEDEVRNFQQAGLIAYATDDDFARLSSVAIWNTGQTEFGRELAAAPDGRTSYGGALIGTPAPTVWLRLAHTRNAAGEHLYRAGTSRDGRNWTWGAVWTFAADTSPRIGLVAHGGDSPPATARFDYLRFYRTSWPRAPR